MQDSPTNKGDNRMKEESEKRITFRLLKKEKRQLQRMAHEQEKGISQLLREIIFARKEVRNQKRR